LFGRLSKRRIIDSFIYSSKTFSVGLGTVVIVEDVADVLDAGDASRFLCCSVSDILRASDRTYNFTVYKIIS